MANAQEREQMLQQMREASNVFYKHAFYIGNHPFIEFNGLINEYINACEYAHRAGIDFTDCNTHSGNELPLHDTQISYINEKLECIFTGRSVMNSLDADHDTQNNLLIANQEQERLELIQQIQTLHRQLAEAQTCNDALHEKVMLQHERVAELELERDDTLAAMRRHLIDVLFCNDEQRQQWQERYRKELPDAVREYERFQQSGVY
jgi:hypothetical protein